MMRKILIIVLSLIATVSYAQETDDSSTPWKWSKPAKRDYPVLNAMVYSAGYGIPLVSNNLMSDVWDQKMGYAAHFTVEYRKQFTEEKVIMNRTVEYPTLWAMGVGVGVSTFSKSADLNITSEQVNSLLDADGDPYNAHLDYQGINEKFSLTYIDVPLYVEIGRPSRSKFKGWAKLGVKGSFLINDSFEGKGTYTARGYYPRWDVLLHDIPELNFLTNQSAYSDSEYKMKSFVLWGTVSAGVSIPLSNYDAEIIRNVVLKLGVKYDFTITPVSDGSSESLFPGSKYRVNQSNYFGGSGSRLHYIGLEIGLIHSF